MPPMTVNGPTPAARRANKLARRAPRRTSVAAPRGSTDAATGLPLTRQQVKSLRANPLAPIRMSKKYVRRVVKISAAVRAAGQPSSPVVRMSDD